MPASTARPKPSRSTAARLRAASRCASRASHARSSKADLTPLRITWLGHSTVLFELDGKRIVTDPVLGRRVAHLWRHSTPVPPLGHLDAVLISHAHHDHLDVRSLRRLAPGTRIFAPAGSAGLLRKKHLGVVEEVAVGDLLQLGPVTVTALPARHATKRSPLGQESTAVGFRVEGSSSAVFFGDTDLFEGMSDMSPSDVALLPVRGWGPTIGAGHMNPERAARAAALLRPRVAIP